LKTVFVSGCFNVLHSGHLRLLRFAKECGDRLVVAVQSDRLAGSSAHVHGDLRLEGVRSIGWVSEAFLYDEALPSVISRLRPDIVVKGKEHEEALNPELDAVNQYGGKLVFSSGESIFSSIDLIRKEYQSSDFRHIRLPQEYLHRHSIETDRLVSLLKQFSQLKVCVVGDLVVDEYITCEPLGMSQEDPTIVVTPLDSIRFVGGAGIVAAHAAGLGAKVQFLTVCGNDSARDFAMSELAIAGVDAVLIVDESRPTTLKQRYRAKGKSLLRVSHLHQGGIDMALQEQIFNRVDRALVDADVLIFSDFNYGCLPQTLVDRLTVIAKTRGILMAADSQSSSQVGDISRFVHMDLLTPTEREARISTRKREDGLVVLAEELRQLASAKNILLKLGEEGLLIHAGGGETEGWSTDRVEALNSTPKDTSGAGDSLLIASAMTLASGGTVWEAACLGSLAAALQVSRVGNIPLTSKELLQELS
jgi:rfaE bifunctional protein kinase chain/domain